MLPTQSHQNGCQHKITRDSVNESRVKGNAMIKEYIKLKSCTKYVTLAKIGGPHIDTSITQELSVYHEYI